MLCWPILGSIIHLLARSLSLVRLFELLVAVVLSAQCTDARINMVTPMLFSRFPTPEALGQASFDEVLDLVRTVSYPRSKAKYLIDLSVMLVCDYGGEVPRDVHLLQKLPGVGRKTANVVTATLYDEANLGVDTHVFRVSKRIGLASLRARTPLAVEREMMYYLPKEDVAKVNHWLVLHGRYICKARKPLCEKCPLTEYCLAYARGKV